MTHILKADNIAALYREAAESYGNKPAFAERSLHKDKEWVSVSYKDLYKKGLELAAALIELGVNYQDKVGILSDNRMEWIITDYGVQLSGAVDIPRGTEISDSDIEYIYNHCEAKILFVENDKIYKRISGMKSHLKLIRHIIIMESPAEDIRSENSDDTLENISIENLKKKKIIYLNKLMEAGRSLLIAGDRRAEERAALIRSDDLFTIIYTTGTTGIPKGVMLTHANILSQIRNLPVNVVETDRALSILPIWHVYERMFEMMTIGKGCCTYYTNVRNIAEDLKTVKPTYVASAPRLWEFLYLRINEKVSKGSLMKRVLFNLALFLAKPVKRSEFYLRGMSVKLKAGNIAEEIGLFLFYMLSWIIVIIPFLILDFTVLRTIRKGLGGAFKGTISGGGALQPHVDEFFNFAGIPVLEGYGLTETSPVLAVRTFEMLSMGTVGPLYPNTELRIVDTETGEILYPDLTLPGQGRGLKGEIHVKGPQVMKGYYKNNELTSQVLKDGWFNTGDLGLYTYNNCLKILGRTKDTIVLLGGENTEPVPIENKLMHSDLIDHSMVVGQDQKHLGLLVCANNEAFAARGMQLNGNSDLNHNDQAVKIMKEEIKRLISAENGFQPHERIVHFRFLPEPFEQGREITPGLGKLKRYIINEKYKDLIDSMYRH
jgi:long-chain acyl-CoA synthetase